MILEMGPAHPVTHGVVQFTIELDGETIKHLDVEIGYLHRAFEKMCEQMTWNQVLPYTDRLNYISPLLNNVLRRYQKRCKSDLRNGSISVLQWKNQLEIPLRMFFRARGHLVV